MLRQLGFSQGTEPDDPICRWVVEDVKVDVMPTDEDILGFSNKWYSQAIENSNGDCALFSCNKNRSFLRTR
jgi:hypothetical protein